MHTLAKFLFFYNLFCCGFCLSFPCSFIFKFSIIHIISSQYVQIHQTTFPIPPFYIRPPSWSTPCLILNWVPPCHLPLCASPVTDWLPGLPGFLFWPYSLILVKDVFQQFSEKEYVDSKIWNLAHLKSLPPPWLTIRLDNRIRGWDLFSRCVLKALFHCFSNIQCC